MSGRSLASHFLLVGQFGRERPAVQIQDAVVRIARIVLRDAVDHRRADIGADAVHHERDVLVGYVLQRDQRFGGLQLVVERHQLELAAERAALGVLARDDELEDLEKLVAGGGERPRERIGVSELDGLFGCRRSSESQKAQDRKRIANKAQAKAHRVLPMPYPFLDRYSLLAGRVHRRRGESIGGTEAMTDVPHRWAAGGAVRRGWIGIPAHPLCPTGDTREPRVLLLPGAGLSYADIRTPLFPARERACDHRPG
jgi:hypothetical protein